MSLALPLLGIAFALASDAEPGEEEAWTLRFAECDHLRAWYKIPPLTAAERMAWMLGGFPPFPRRYIVSYGRVRSKLHPGRMTRVLKIFQAPSLLEVQEWGKGFKLLFKDNIEFELHSQKGSIRIQETAKELSDRFRVLYWPYLSDKELLRPWMLPLLYRIHNP